MKDISLKKKAFIVFLLFILFLPLSNLIGLTKRNELIKPVSGVSQSFNEASRILQDKCIDCHSPGMTRFPIYAKLPLAQQLMESDINNASSRFVLTKENYSGEATLSPLMLARLEGVIRNNSMPPNLYLSMHWNGRPNEIENRKLLAWIADEREKLAWSSDSAPTLKGEPIQPLPLKVTLNQRKVDLGKSLFFDYRLSGDKTLNCASCHDLTKGGTDQEKVATGIRGQKGPINSPSVYNASYNLAQFWDGRAKDLVEQAAGPVANPGEMGAEWGQVVATISQDEHYKALFSEAYPNEGISQHSITHAIATFEESLVTGGSRFDEYLRGNKNALSPAEKNGYFLFKMNCASCHFGPTLGGMSYEKMGRREDYFRLRGGSITEVDNGRYNVTRNESDRHFFKVPNLRNVELTYPYFHDGSASTLQEAVRTMALVQVGKRLKDSEIEDIVTFLKTLTGDYHEIPLGQLKYSEIEPSRSQN